MPSEAASSARGGRSSAANTDVPDRSADNTSIVQETQNREPEREPEPGTRTGTPNPEPEPRTETTVLLYRPVTPAALRETLARFPQLPLVASPTPVEPLPRLREVLGGGPRLFIKRD